MTIRYTVAGPCDHRDEIQALLEEHWCEVAKNKELMALAPDWGRYQELHDGGRLVVVYAWAGSSLVGYSCTIVDKHIHYLGLTVASNDVLFVSKRGRNSPVGLRLMALTERLVKTQGAQLMLWHAKENSPLDRILKAKRFAVQDIIYSRPL